MAKKNNPKYTKADFETDIAEYIAESQGMTYNDAMGILEAGKTEIMDAEYTGKPVSKRILRKLTVQILGLQKNWELKVGQVFVVDDDEKHPPFEIVKADPRAHITVQWFDEGGKKSTANYGYGIAQQLVEDGNWLFTGNIKDEMPDKYAVGKWYKDSTGWFVNYQSDTDWNTYGFTPENKWKGGKHDSWRYSAEQLKEDGFVKAPKHEVEFLLAQEALQRGYKANTVYASTEDGTPVTIKPYTGFTWEYQESGDMLSLFADGHLYPIYLEGRWAKILDSPATTENEYATLTQDQIKLLIKTYTPLAEGGNTEAKQELEILKTLIK